MKIRLVTMGVGGAAVLAAVLTGCSSTDSSSTPTNAAATSSSASASTSTAEGSTRATEMAAFDKCMANNGVTMPAHNGMRRRTEDGTPPSGAPAGAPSGAPGQAPEGGSGGTPPARQHTMTAPPGVDQATWTKALAACKSLEPTRHTQPTS
ncbi:hypothetical protein [Gordonia polyisoprenivorans]|uniref:hypothetical protein n=1 Tax=Gordonia polyisoprenivorans TaxID=84595 RepID=UPI0030CEE4B5